MWGLIAQIKELQQDVVIASKRIKELEGIIEQGLAYVNHLEEDNKRLKEAVRDAATWMANLPTDAQLDMSVPALKGKTGRALWGELNESTKG